MDLENILVGYLPIGPDCQKSIHEPLARGFK